MHAGKSQFVPGISSHANSLVSRLSGPGAKSGVRQPRAIHQLHLTDMRHRIDRKQRIEHDVAQGLFAGFAPRAVFGRFMFFEKAGRQGPVVLSWFDRAAAQQDVAVIARQPNPRRFSDWNNGCVRNVRRHSVRHCPLPEHGARNAGPAAVASFAALAHRAKSAQSLRSAKVQSAPSRRTTERRDDFRFETVVDARRPSSNVRPPRGDRASVAGCPCARGWSAIVIRATYGAIGKSFRQDPIC